MYSISRYIRDLGPFPTVILSAWFIWNFSTNLFFSQNFVSMQYRGIDDVAFHLVLRRVHDGLLNGELLTILSINDYAYGWFFWIINSLLTFPAYVLLSAGQGVIPNEILEQLIIVLPRQLSLVFVTISILFWISSLRKLYSLGYWVVSAALPVILLIPAVTYAATKFHPTGFQMFLTSMAVYLAVSNFSKEINKRSTGTYFFWSFLLLSLSLWTKVTLLPIFIGITFLLIVIFWLSRRTLAWMLLPAFSAFFIAFFASSPDSLIQVLTLQPPIYLERIVSQAEQVTSGVSGWERFEGNLLFGVDSSILSLPVLAALGLGACVQSWRAWSSRNRAFSIFLLGLVFTNFLTLIYFSFSVSAGPAYVAIYSSVAIAPLAFGFLGLVPTTKRSRFLILLSVAALVAIALPRNLLANSAAPGTGMQLNHFQTLHESYWYERRIESADGIAKSVARASVTTFPVKVLADYRVPKYWSPLDTGFVSSYSFDNMHLWETDLVAGVFDLILLSKEAPWFNAPDESSQSDREFVSQFLASIEKKESAVRYQVIYEDELVIVLKRE